MSVETLGEAWRLGWRVTARCAFGNRNDEVHPPVHLSFRVGHEDAGLDTRAKFPALAPQILQVARILSRIGEPVPKRENDGRGRPKGAKSKSSHRVR